MTLFTCRTDEGISNLKSLIIRSGLLQDILDSLKVLSQMSRGHSDNCRTALQKVEWH